MQSLVHTYAAVKGLSWLRISRRSRLPPCLLSSQSFPGVPVLKYTAYKLSFMIQASSTPDGGVRGEAARGERRVRSEGGE